MLINRNKYDLRFGNLIFLICCLFFSSSCKKLVEVNSPTTSITGENVFTNDATSAAVLTGIYTQMSLDDIKSGSLTSIGFLTGLSGDELTLYDGASDQLLISYYKNNIVLNLNGPWNKIYPVVFLTNSAIEKISKSTSLSSAVKQQLLGEAKFMRAFCFFYLVNLYGDVPLVTGTDYTASSVMARTPKNEVWNQIIGDLKDAKNLLSDNYVDATLTGITTERIRPNKWAATAMLARCYLYTGDWNNAEILSTETINHSQLYHLDSLSNVFLSNNWEAIWQLQPVQFGSNTEDAKLYLLHSDGLTVFRPVYLSDQLVNSFEANDQRSRTWMDTITLSGKLYHFASKYKVDQLEAPVTEYNTILRLGEQYLIRAEARAQQKNLQGSLMDLNTIRKRAWLTEIKATSSQQLLTAIYHERQLELFTEWGHRWLDMKRVQIVNSIMSIVAPEKGGTWSPNWQFYPIPPSDILTNSNITQNPGY